MNTKRVILKSLPKGPDPFLHVFDRKIHTLGKLGIIIINRVQNFAIFA
jgi:hypothetical protein